MDVPDFNMDSMCTVLFKENRMEGNAEVKSEGVLKSRWVGIVIYAALLGHLALNLFYVCIYLFIYIFRTKGCWLKSGLA